ncbi:PH domain-containing protein [Natronosalvus halobius]|uniref:PH domain-containing protein n=1 Tax=Natronosalvus halobius TaxID=2953746 RepID=UPI00209FA163|nr:PH domain-containing protein [Natronosalvus halobius]USZ71045.1 PH domain-containing protein [Natronosalvus halobius]
MGETYDADWLHLADGEAVVWESRPHPIDMGWKLPMGLGLMLIGIVVLGLSAGTEYGLARAIGLAVGAVGLVVVTATYLRWTSTRYVLTTSQLYRKRGILSRDVTQFRLDRVQNTTLEQGVLERFLGYGQLTVYTAGSADPELTFTHVPNPERAAGRLSAELEGDTGIQPT